jgi:Flp pilus assembly protein TadG
MKVADMHILKQIRSDQNGTSVTEFGLIAIPLFMMMMGTLDTGYTYYVKAVVAGEINKLARASSLEGASTAYQQCLVDDQLRNTVKTIVPQAKLSTLDCPARVAKMNQKYDLEAKLKSLGSLTPQETTTLNTIKNEFNEDIFVTRRYYTTFTEAAAARAEILVSDANNNQKCDPNDTYIDKNNNDDWDADGGSDGQGGARDVVIIKVTVAFERMFPIQKMVMNLPNNVVLVSDSVLANQPYGAQRQPGTAVTKDC